MIVRDVSFNDPEDNLLYDEVLLKIAEAGGEGGFLRLWESPVYFIVLGRVCKYQTDVIHSHVRDDGVPVFRRVSGGGTVLQGPGCLNYSLVLSKKTNPAIEDLRGSYQWILSRIVTELRAEGVDSAFYPVSDLALRATRQKFSGNAQKRGRNCVLHHGTLLYNMDINRICRYLAMPPDQPDYRGQRPHGSFVTNLPLSQDTIRNLVCRAFAPQTVRGRDLPQREADALMLLRQQSPRDVSLKEINFSND